MEIEFADEHADRAGDGGWFGIDPVCRHRHVVAARGGDIAHAGDHRLVLLLAGPDELAPDEIGGGAVATGGVDAHHDGTDCRIVGERVDAAGDAVGSGDLHPAERRGAARAASDVALHPHDADARPRSPAVVADRGLLERCLAQERGAAAQDLANLLFELIGIREPVDQPFSQRLLRGEQTPIEEPPELPFVEVSLPRHLADIATEHVVEQGVGDLALLLRHVAAGEDVGRVLVGADPDELRLHAELFEARAGEQRRRGEAVHRQDGLRGHDDPVGYRGDSIVEVPAGFQVKEDLLARPPQSLDSLSQFFRPPRPERHPPGPQDDGLDRSVAGQTREHLQCSLQRVAMLATEHEILDVESGTPQRLVEVDVRRRRRGERDALPGLGSEANLRGQCSGVAPAEARSRAKSQVRKVDLRADLEAEGGVRRGTDAGAALIEARLAEQGETAQDTRFHRERAVRRIDAAGLA